jgi:hypothetical protein
VVALSTLLDELQVLKCNKALKKHSEQKSAYILNELDKIVREI